MVGTSVCRCCLSEACYKDISNEYVHSGVKEIYADMLLDTFNINISYQDTNSRLICEECIPRLRDAAVFKKQVLDVEYAITKRILLKEDFKDNSYKLTEDPDDFVDHITGDFDDDVDDGKADDDEDNGFGDDFGWPEDNLQKQVDDNKYVIKLEPEDDIPLQLLRNSKIFNQGSEINKGKNKSMILAKNKKEKIENDFTQKTKTKKSLLHHDRKENSLKLINNSNICLFESLKTKFRCFYCKETFFKINDLRKHTLTHSNQSYLKMCINRLQGMSFKCVDISNLTCKLCSETLKDLSDLQTHLSEMHNMQFCGKENMLIQYRLEKSFDCVMCEQNFNSFFKLSVHMNNHYSNHVCEICGASYINRLSLRMHVNSRHRESKCTLCSAKFSNAYLRVKHMRKMHNSSQSKRYCLICNKTFRYTYLLDEHKIQEHGMKRSISVCQECGKSFLSAVNLRTHIRCVHIKERNHPCTHCGMCFFTSCDRRRHERTHQDFRSFSCNYCEGRFKSKDSLRRHLKRQHGNLYVTENQSQTLSL